MDHTSELSEVILA